MTRRHLSFILCLLLIALLPLHAQDFDESYTWDDIGIRMDYPDDWDIIEDDDTVSFRSEETDLLIFFDDDYDADDDELVDYVEEAFEDYRFDEDLRFDSDDVVFTDLDDFDDVAIYFYEDAFNDEEFDRVIFAIPLTDDLLAIAIALPLVDDEIQEYDIVLDILSTLTVGDSDNQSEDDYTFENDYTISLGDGWSAEENIFTNDEIDVEIILYEVEDERQNTRASSLRDTYLSFATGDSLNEDVLAFLFLENDPEAIEYGFDTNIDGEDVSVLIVSMALEDDYIVVAIASASDGTGDDVYDNVINLYDFLETLDN